MSCAFGGVTDATNAVARPRVIITARMRIRMVRAPGWIVTAHRITAPKWRRPDLAKIGLIQRPSVAGVGDQPGGLDAGDRADLVLVRGVAADADRAQERAVGGADQHAALDWHHAAAR